METQYKYISKPYTLEELVNGNPIFKIYCEYFNNLYDYSVQKEAYDTGDNYITVEHFELIFNEFLNILSLLIYDKSSYNDTLKKIELKNEELDHFSQLVFIIPEILENLHSISDSPITIILEKLLSKDKKPQINNIEPSLGNEEHWAGILEIAKKHCENLENTLTYENIIDLTYFFDIPYEEALEKMTSNFPHKNKRKEKKTTLKSENINPVNTSLQVLLLEEILVLGEKWEELNPTSKSSILCHLFGKNKDNIRDVYYEINKPKPTYSKKILSDMKKAEELIKKITG
jgi:hypothetical protein